MAEPAATIGDNKGPSLGDYRALNEALPGLIDIEEAALFKRFDELVESFGRTPAVVDSPELDAKFTDFVRKQLGGLKSALEDAQKIYKRPFLDGGSTVDGLFKRRVDKVVACQTELRRRQTEYKEKIEAEERRKRQEQERLAREEEERKRQEAEAAAAAARDAASLDDAIAAEEAAKQAEAKRIEAENAAKARASDLTRSRGDMGGVSSLRSEWKCEVSDRETLDLNALRPYLSVDDLNKACRGWIKANAPKDHQAAAPVLTGAKVYVHRFTR